jgi:hypothetical protein
MKRPVCSLLLLPWLAFGCVNADETWREIDVVVTVESAAPGPVFVDFHHAEVGEGLLAHPLGLIESVDVDGPGGFLHPLLYPAHAGEGLVVYAWQDLDGDGLLCAPGTEHELAGLTTARVDGPFDAVAVVRPSVPCAGAERLIP